MIKINYLNEFHGKKYKLDFIKSRYITNINTDISDILN